MMKTIGRFISAKELYKYNDKFNSKTYINLFEKLNLPQNNTKYDIVELTHIPDSKEENIVIETNKLIDFGDEAKAVLSYYQTKKGNDLTYEGEVFQLWKREGKHVVFKEYVNGNLVDSKVEDGFIDIYKDYLGVGKDTSSLFYNPASCIQSGSCCYFEGKRYEHCGKYCGIYENAGGGTPINALDRCCRTHDVNIKGKKGRDRCPAHKKFMSCSKGLKAPGIRTIRTGIRIDTLASGCGVI